MYHPTKPQLLITGSGPHLGQIAQLCDQLHAERFTWIGEAGVPPKWVKALGGQVVQSLDALSPDVIVIGGSTSEKGNFSFPPNPNEWTLKGSNLQINHPVALADRLPLNFTGHYVTCGYPGSGNGLVQAILESLLATIPHAPFRGNMALLAAYGADYSRRFDELANLFGKSLNANSASWWATFKENTCSITWSHGSNSSSILFGLPIRNYLYEKVHKTHEPFGAKIKKLLNSGATGILSVRNPFDTVISVANKAATEGVDLLGTEWLLRMVARGLVEYYESCIDVITSQRITIVRYEDCQTQFERVVKLIASQCEIRISKEHVDELKKRLLNRPVAHTSHLWKPDQPEKWRQYLGAQQLNLLLEEGVGEIADMLQYPTPRLKDACTYPDQISKHFLSPVAPHRLLLSCIADPVNQLDKLAPLNVSYYQADKELYFVSNAPETLQHFETFIKETDFLHLVRAGSFSDEAGR